MANKEKEVLDTISHQGNGNQDHSKVHFISSKMFIIKKTEKEQVVLNLWRSRDPQTLMGRMCNVRGVEQLAVPSITPLRTLRRNELTCLHRNMPTNVHSSMSHSSTII